MRRCAGEARQPAKVQAENADFEYRTEWQKSAPQDQLNKGQRSLETVNAVVAFGGRRCRIEGVITCRGNLPNFKTARRHSLLRR